MIIRKLIKSFQAKSLNHLIIIFVIFAISGSCSVLVSSSLLSAIDLKNIISFYPLYIFIRIVIIIPIYQLMLILIATLFGEFKYFWKFEKNSYNDYV